MNTITTIKLSKKVVLALAYLKLKLGHASYNDLISSLPPVRAEIKRGERVAKSKGRKRKRS